YVTQAPEEHAGAQTHDDAVVLLCKGVDRAPQHDAVAASLFVEPLPEAGLLLLYFRSARFDVTAVGLHRLEDALAVEIAISEAVGKRLSDFVALAPELAGHRDYRHGRASLKPSALSYQAGR